MKSPDWSHVANPSRCQFCRSECHLSSDELYPEPALLQLALTQLPPADRPRYRGHEDVKIGSRSQLQGEMDSIYWWDGREDSMWAESASAKSGLMSGSRGSELTSEDDGSGSSSRTSTNDSSLELSNLESTSSQTAHCRSPSSRGQSINLSINVSVS